MNSFASSETIHAGHNHGTVGEWIEHLLEHTSLSENVQHCLGHIIVDALNVFVLLLVVMMAVFFISSYINMDKLHKKLASLKSIWGFLLAIGIGILSPFCSCSIIPILMGFLSMGVPVSVCLCYLTASSMINITAVLSLSATMGFSFTLTYVLCALAIIIISTILFSIMKLDNSISAYHAHHHKSFVQNQTIGKRIASAFSCTLDVLKRSAIFILLGVILSSVIMTFFSIDTLSAIVNDNSVLSVSFASLVGIPIHSDIFSIAPIIQLLFTLSPSVALSFTLSTMAISLPSIIILARAIKTKTVFAYCGIIIALTILTGFISLIFN